MRTRHLTAQLLAASLAAALVGWSAPASDAATYAPSNPTPIAISTGGPGPASPFPSAVSTYGLATTVTDVNVTLNGLSHTNPDDLDIELVGPDHTAVVLISDVWGTTDLTGVTMTFDDQASAALPNNKPCTSGSYRPTNVDTGDAWKVDPSGTILSVFNGKNPNGDWSLYVSDDASNDGGSIAAGWTISITTAGTAAITVPGPSSTNGAGVARPYPYAITVSGASKSLSDLNVTLPGLTHPAPGTLDMLLVGPDGTKVLIMSGACGSLPLSNVTFTFDDEAAQHLSRQLGTCTSGRHKPTASGTPAPTLPPPAPPGPYAPALSAFRGTDPNGTWYLYVDDTRTNGGGWLTGAPELKIHGDRNPPNTKIVLKPKSSGLNQAKVKFTRSERGRSSSVASTDDGGTGATRRCGCATCGWAGTGSRCAR